MIPETMIQFLLKKLTLFSFSLLAVFTITFVLMNTIPGDPLLDEQITREVHTSLCAFYGLDTPLLLRYLNTLKNFLCLDFGTSILHGCPVSQILASGLPVSLRLGIEALALAVPVGLLIGTWTAFRRSRVLSLVSLIGMGLPPFVLAVLSPWPPLSLALLPAAFLARFTRISLLEVLQQHFIRTAIAKGLSPFRIVLVHAWRNILPPICAYLGPLSAKVFLGSFAVERTFALPGLGMWLHQAVLSRDYPTIVGIAVFSSMMLMLTVLLFDFFHMLLDPRCTLR
jgi:oligopeptide transport system permease protein